MLFHFFGKFLAVVLAVVLPFGIRESFSDHIVEFFDYLWLFGSQINLFFGVGRQIVEFKFIDRVMIRGGSRQAEWLIFLGIINKLPISEANSAEQGILVF